MVKGPDLTGGGLQEDLKLNKSLVGKTFPGESHRIEPQRVLEFRRFLDCIGPSNTWQKPILAEGEQVHPMFLNHLSEGRGLPEIFVGFHHRHRTPGGETLEALAPIHIGDTINTTSRLVDMYTKKGRSGTMLFVVWETEFTNQGGELVGRIRLPLIYTQ
jgi:hypothetical protein